MAWGRMIGLKNDLTGGYEWKNEVTSAADTPEGYTYVGKDDGDIIKDLYGSSSFTVSDWDVGQVGAEDFDNPYSGRGAAFFNAKAETTLSVNLTADVTTESNDDFSVKSKEFNGVNVFAAVSGEVIAPHPGIDMKLNKIEMSLNGTQMDKFQSNSANLMPGGDVPTLSFQSHIDAAAFQSNHINLNGPDFTKTSLGSSSLSFKFQGIYVNGNSPMKLPGALGLSGISNYTNLSLSINRR